MKNLILFLAVLFVTVSAIAAPTPMPQAQAEKLADCIYLAEGGDKTSKPYGIVSVRVSGKDEARKVCLNTIKNNYIRSQKAGSQGDYLAFLAGKYCPIGCDNDNGLNKNWLKNVRALLAK